jgi:hypothetical protein
MGSSTGWEYTTLFFIIPLIEKSESDVCNSGRGTILVQLGMLRYAFAALDSLISENPPARFVNLQCLEIYRIICLKIADKESVIPALVE